MPEHGPPPEGERTAIYSCEDGTGFTVRFAPNGETATVERAGADRPLVLPIQPSGSGFHYATPRHSLRGKIGRVHVGTPVTNAHLDCRLLLEKKTNYRYHN